MMQFPKLHPKLWFVGLAAVLFLVYAYQKVLGFPVHSIHTWRQSDCLSLAHNFMEINNPFKPAIHNYISDDQTSGRSAGEFTGLYYVIGKLWSLFGKHEWMYRATNLFLLLGACFSLFSSLLRVWKNTFWSLFVSLFVFTSPLIVFYAANFLTDATALSFTIFGAAIFLRYLENKEIKKLATALFLLALGALFKVTAGIFLLSLFGLYFFEILGFFKSSSPIFPKRKSTFILFASMLLLIVSWYSYAEHYNHLHGGKYTFNNLWPLWALSAENYANAIKFFTNFTFSQFFHPLVFWLICAFGCSALILSFLRNRPLFFLIVFMLFGSALYIIFWFGALENHDYYFINLFTLPLLLLIVNIHYLLASNREQLKKVALVSATILFSLGVVYSASNIRLRYSHKLTAGVPLAEFFFSKDTNLYLRWISQSDGYQILSDMEAYNRKLGVRPNDLVICYPDPSFNISLYLLNQKGWTAFNNQQYEAERVQTVIDRGAKYLIINRYEVPNQKELESFMTDSIGFFKGYTIFQLKP